MPESGTIDGKQYADVFRVEFTVTVPERPDCDEWEIHVEIWEHDEGAGFFPLPDDLTTASPFPLGRCYKLQPGAYTFNVGDHTPDGKATNKDPIKSPPDPGKPLAPGQYVLPPWAPMTFSGDPGPHYEFYVKVRLIPCCEGTEAEEVLVSSEDNPKESRVYGGTDWLEKLGAVLKELGAPAVGVAEKLTTPKSD